MSEIKKDSVGGEKRVEKLVTGTVKTKKKNNIHKLTDVFVEADVASVKSYIINDVFIPSIKKVVWEMLSGGAEMMFWGKTSGNRSRSSGSKISYRDYYDRRDDDRFRSNRVSTRFDYDDIVYESRGEAERVLVGMEEALDRYGVVTVSDMYDMADLTAPYTSARYGWTSLRNVDVQRIREGYILKLPKAMPID